MGIERAAWAGGVPMPQPVPTRAGTCLAARDGHDYRCHDWHTARRLPGHKNLPFRQLRLPQPQGAVDAGNMTETTSQNTYDVVVVGGGAAGLSAALVLGRSRRSVLVVDAGQPRNAPAEGVHGFLTRDGMNPLELLELGRAEVRGYGGEIISGRVQSARRVDDTYFALTLDQDDRTLTARRLLIATGLVDELPAIPGIRERWGHDVIHCPYCHGWEVRDQPIGVLATSSMALHQVVLFRQLTSDLVLFTHTAPPLTDEQLEELAARDVRVVPGIVDRLEIENDHLVGVRLQDGTVFPRTALVVAPRFVARSEVLAQLGLKPAEHATGGEFVAGTDISGRTEVPGVWVAGNVTDLSATVVTAASEGVLAAAMLNYDLALEDTRSALTVHRARDRHAIDVERIASREFWDARYASADAIWSGNPNAQLVAQVADLRPGTALDVACGEGGDAIWLAQHGWQVTAVDISTVALDRAATLAGPESHIEWQQADVLAWQPPAAQYDLVTAHFLHLPQPQRDTVYQRLASGVRPGGHLLVVGHHPSDVHMHMGHPERLGLLFSPDEMAALLDPSDWDIVVASTPSREAKSPDGEPMTVHDSVLLALRRPVV